MTLTNNDFSGEGFVKETVFIALFDFGTIGYGNFGRQPPATDRKVINQLARHQFEISFIGLGLGAIEFAVLGDQMVLSIWLPAHCFTPFFDFEDSPPACLSRSSSPIP